MLGWSISARAWRSASNRAMTCLRVHARLDDLQRHLAADGLRLLGHVDDAHAPFADLLQQLVGADDRAGALGDRRQSTVDGQRPPAGRFQEAAALLVGTGAAASRPGAQAGIAAAGLRRGKRGPCLRRESSIAGHVKIASLIELDAFMTWSRPAAASAPQINANSAGRFSQRPPGSSISMVSRGLHVSPSAISWRRSQARA